MHLFSTSTKTGEFFRHIKPMESRSIRYNSVYLILACVENFASTVTLKFYVYQLVNEIDDYRLVFIVLISLLREVLMHEKIKYTVL